MGYGEGEAEAYRRLGRLTKKLVSEEFDEAAQDRCRAHVVELAETWRSERDQLLAFIREPKRRDRLKRWSRILETVGDVGDGLLEFSSGLLEIVDAIGDVEPDLVVGLHGDTATISRTYLSQLERDSQDLDGILRHLREERSAECLHEWSFRRRIGVRKAQEFAGGLLDLLEPIDARDRSAGLIVGDGTGRPLPPIRSESESGGPAAECSAEDGCGTPRLAVRPPPSDWGKVELDPEYLRRPQTVQEAIADVPDEDGWARREIDEAARRLSNTSSASPGEIRTAIYQYARIHRVGWSAAADAMPAMLQRAARRNVSLLQAISRVAEPERSRVDDRLDASPEMRVAFQVAARVEADRSPPEEFRLVQTPAIREVGQRVLALETRAGHGEAMQVSREWILDVQDRLGKLEARPDPTEISGRLENWRRIDTEFVDKALDQLETFFDDGLGAAGDKWAEHETKLDALVLENIQLQRSTTRARRLVEAGSERFVAFVATHSDTRSRLDRIEKSIGPYSVSNILGEICDHIGSQDWLENEKLHKRIKQLEDSASGRARAASAQLRDLAGLARANGALHGRLEKAEKQLRQLLSDLDVHSETRVRVSDLEADKEVGVLARLEPIVTSIARLEDLLWRLAREVSEPAPDLRGVVVDIAARLEGDEDVVLAGDSLMRVRELRDIEEATSAASDHDAADADTPPGLER